MNMNLFFLYIRGYKNKYEIIFEGYKQQPMYDLNIRKR